MKWPAPGRRPLARREAQLGGRGPRLEPRLFPHAAALRHRRRSQRHDGARAAVPEGRAALLTTFDRLHEELGVRVARDFQDRSQPLAAARRQVEAVDAPIIFPHRFLRRPAVRRHSRLQSTTVAELRDPFFETEALRELALELVPFVEQR